MSHEITFRDVQFGLAMAWHRLTTIVENITMDTAGAMLYEMEAVPLTSVVTLKDENGNAIQETDRDGVLLFDAQGDPINKTIQVDANAKQIISRDDNLAIGKPVGLDYKMLTNREIFEAVENALVGTSHTLASAGTCRERSLAYISIQIAEAFKSRRGDLTQPLLNIQWGHGGNQTLCAVDSATKVVCANTYKMSLGGVHQLNMRHTKNADVLKLEECIENHIGVSAEFALAMARAESQEVNAITAREVFAGFAWRTPKGKPQVIPAEFSKTGATRLGNHVDRLEDLFHNGRGNLGEDRADLFNAVTDFYTHESSGGEDRFKQFTSSEFGDGATKKQQFFNVIADRAGQFESTRQHGEKVLLALN